ncbi:hypothetical protein D3C86_1881880 [compost metagenome]
MIDELFYRFFKVREAHLFKDVRPKTNIEEVCHRMIATNIIIERRPVVSIFRIPGRFGIVRVCIAQHVPAATGIPIHCVGFAFSRTTTGRACRVHPVSYAR